MPPRILIVEDDTTFRSLLRAILNGEGYETVEAADGRKGGICSGGNSSTW